MTDTLPDTPDTAVVEFVQDEQRELQVIGADDVGGFGNSSPCERDQGVRVRVLGQDADELTTERSTRSWHLHRTLGEDRGTRRST